MGKMLEQTGWDEIVIAMAATLRSRLGRKMIRGAMCKSSPQSTEGLPRTWEGGKRS